MLDALAEGRRPALGESPQRWPTDTTFGAPEEEEAPADARETVAQLLGSSPVPVDMLVRQSRLTLPRWWRPFCLSLSWRDAWNDIRATAFHTPSRRRSAAHRRYQQSLHDERRRRRIAYQGVNHRQVPGAGLHGRGLLRPRARPPAQGRLGAAGRCLRHELDRRRRCRETHQRHRQGRSGAPRTCSSRPTPTGRARRSPGT